jgi:histidine triad (HIT) family protein
MTNGVDTGPSVFTRILNGEIPSEIVLQTDRVFVIRDIAPQAPVHLLVIPKVEDYKDVTDLATKDPGLLAELVEVARTAAVQAGSPDFRLVFNTGAGAGQTVFHVHAHLLGGAGLHEQSLGGAQQHERSLGGDLEEGSLGRG